jgi:hypothetical protein
MQETSPVSDLAGYTALLREFRQRGYAVRDFHAVDPAARHLILRHDIDMSLREAAVMAQAEAQAGVIATYFVMLRSEMYNPFTSGNQEALQSIMAAGHHIGLHFDPSHYLDPLDRHADDECAILEKMIGRRIEITSLHRPPTSTIGQIETLGGRPCTYSSFFVNEIGYCSDSRGEWRFGHPLQHEAVTKGRALQLLTHPVWWTGTPAESVVDRLRRLLSDHGTVMDKDLADNSEPYRAARNKN